MKIKNLVLTDYSAVDMLMSELHELHAKNRPDIYAPAKHIYSEEQFAEMIGNENTFAIGAEIEGELAGMCFFDIRGKNPKTKSGVVPNTTAFISDIVVGKKFRRKGIAKKLFEEAEHIAKENGAVRIDLMVWSFNEDAIEFYKSMGMSTQRFVFEKEI